jgi:protein-tyrosine phosphatase
MNNEFIDIHCHVLPGLDEGPSTQEESVKMLQLAYEDGVTGIVATPHIMNGLYKNTKETIDNAISELRRLANHVRIYIGAEIRIDRDLAARVVNNELPLINNKKFILLELPTYVIPPIAQLENIVKSLKMHRITPIFAHPERNIPILKDLSVMEKLIRCGAFFQVTAMSLRDPGLRSPVLKMINKGYVHAVASDAHDARKRPPILSVAYEIISKKIGNEIAEKLFTYNPLKIIRGEDIGQGFGQGYT